MISTPIGNRVANLLTPDSSADDSARASTKSQQKQKKAAAHCLTAAFANCFAYDIPSESNVGSSIEPVGARPLEF